MKKIFFNKKKIGALMLAAGISLCSRSGLAEIFSLNKETTLKDGRSVKVYFTTGMTANDYAYVSFDNAVGYLSNSEINYLEYGMNNYYSEVLGSKMVLQDSFIYQTPNENSGVISNINKNEYVNLVAKNNDGWYVVITSNNLTGFIHENAFKEKVNQVLMAKITGNNVNVRSSASTKEKNVIGFADITDSFTILGKDGDWYIIDYLGNTGYINSKYVKETYVDEEELNIKKIVYVDYDTPFYSDTNGTVLSFLPRYQDATVIGEENGFYKVKIDGCIGFIDKRSTKNLSKNFTLVDLPRQRVRTFKNYKEVHRAHMISGRKSMPTEIGCFKIGHTLKDYQLTPDYVVKYWMQYNGDIGLHDASWQEHDYFVKVANDAYELFAKGKGITAPDYHPSHGCNNLEEIDAAIIYSYISVGDNVLVIGPNSLINDHVLSSLNSIIHQFVYYSLDEDILDNMKVKKLV